MRKYKIILSSVALLCSFGIFLFTVIKFYKKDSYVYKCESDVRFDVSENGKTSSIDALYVLTLGQKKNGFIHMTGVVKVDGKKLDLNRTYYFDYTKNEKIDVYNFLIKKEDVSVYDSVDSKFFQETFLPEKPGASVYIKPGKIKDNLFIFDGFGYTHMICVGG